MRPDIVVHDSTHDVVLAVEVKARRGVDRVWAAQLRRNLHAHGARVAAAFFMILTTDETYLWRESGRPATDAEPPDAVVATSALIGNDLANGEAVDGRALELLASAWLSAVVAAESSAHLRESSRDFLVGTGLFEALRGAAVAFEVA